MTSSPAADTDYTVSHLAALPLWLLVSASIVAVGLTLLLSCSPTLRRISLFTDPEEGSPGCLCLFLYFALLLLAAAFHQSILLGLSALTGCMVAGWWAWKRI